MPRFAWTTDIHLDHLYGDVDVVNFANSLIVTDPPGIFVTGDISSATKLVYHLSIIERTVKRPVYFVLGNHDFYNGDIESVRKSMRELSNMSQFLKYMPLVSYQILSPATALVGHDGWYDAFYGDVNGSRFLMNDWSMIKDFVQHSGGHTFMQINRNIANRTDLIALARKLAHEGVVHIMNGIKSAVKYHKNVIILTHVPPFRESHVFQGKMGDDDAQPWFTSKMLGDMLLNAATTYPNVNFVVLCGHTHGKYDGSPLPNLRVHVGGATYRQPELAGLIDVA
jgi:predicted MPP superfamily phosphohydrolase